MTTTIARPGSIVGTPINRIDGHLKVTGQAQYAADVPVENVTYAAIVSSTIARGKILSIESDAALAIRGVLRIFTHENTSKFKQPGADFQKGIVPAQTFMPLQGPEIVHYGQQIAIVVAETFEGARAAAELLEVAYEANPPVVSYGCADGRTLEAGRILR